MRWRHASGVIVTGLALLLAACGSTERDFASKKRKTTNDSGSVSTQDPGVPDAGTTTSTGPRGRKTSNRRASTVSGVRDVPSAGITDTFIKVGVDDIHFEEAAGIPITRPPGKQWAEVVIKDLNAHGGVAGRKIEAIYHRYKSDTFIQEEPAACAHYGEDAKVAVVIAQSFGHTPDFLACLARHNILFIEGGHLGHDQESLARFPLYVNADWMSMSRSAPLLARGLLDQGYFGLGSVVGILTHDEPHYRRTTDLIIQELAARGVSVDRVATTSRRATLAEIQGQMSSAVLKFKSPPEVNRVIFWHSTASLLFPTAAESQHYRPTYGVSTNDFPIFVMTLTKAKEQLRGLKGVGWSPNDDVSRPERWPAWDRCVALMKAAGLTWSDSNAERGALVHCDAGWLLAAGAARAGNRLTPATLLAGIEAIRGSFDSAASPVTHFGPGRHDGATSLRDLTYDEGCDCLRYTSGLRTAN